MKSRLSTVLALLAATMLLASGTAEATVYSVWGATGKVGPTPVGICRYYPYFNNKLVTSNYTHPVIFARDYNAGLGNDWQWVRYTPYLVDLNGKFLMQGQPTQLRQAGDNFSAQFSAAEIQKLVQFSQNHIRLVLYIEWVNRTQTQVLGSARDLIDKYYSYYGDNTTPPYGPANMCSYFKPVGVP